LYGKKNLNLLRPFAEYSPGKEFNCKFSTSNYLRQKLSFLSVLNLILNGCRGPFPGAVGGCEIDYSLRLAQRLRTRGAAPALPLHAFIAWTDTTLPFSKETLREYG
jgi:hypothetical protein